MGKTVPFPLRCLLLSIALPAWAEPPPRFPPDAVWHQDIRAAPAFPARSAP